MAINDNHISIDIIYTMIVSGILGCILISCLAIHTLYHIYTKKLGTHFSTICYVLFFSTCLLSNMGFALFRSNILLPMGTSIDCKIGYYFSVFGWILTRVLIVTIFLLKIDLAFYDSALGFSRKTLFMIGIPNMTISSIGLIWWTIESWTSIKALNDHSDDVMEENMIIVCAIDSYSTTLQILPIFSFLNDFISNGIVCAMFVYKLHKVIKHTSAVTSSVIPRIKTGNNSKELSQSRSRTPRNNYKHRQQNHLQRLMKKQTILVIIASISSLLFLVSAPAVYDISFLLGIDCTINVVCVWLMFSFADQVWNGTIHAFCFLCCCGRDGSDFIMHPKLLELKKQISRSLKKISMVKSTNESIIYGSTERSAVIKDRDSRDIDLKEGEFVEFSEDRNSSIIGMETDFRTEERHSSSISNVKVISVSEELDSNENEFNVERMSSIKEDSAVVFRTKMEELEMENSFQKQ